MKRPDPTTVVGAAVSLTNNEQIVEVAIRLFEVILDSDRAHEFHWKLKTLAKESEEIAQAMDDLASLYALTRTGNAVETLTELLPD